MAGALKRASPDQHEEKTLLCALNDSNLPKFLAADAVLFGGILSDLFPGVSLPVRDYGIMEEVIGECRLICVLLIFNWNRDNASRNYACHLFSI